MQKLSVERNIIITSLQEIISRLQLLKLKYLDLNLNQIDWEEDWVRRQGYEIVRKHRDKKMVNDKVIKVRSVDIGIDEDLQIKVMSTEDMYKH